VVLSSVDSQSFPCYIIFDDDGLIYSFNETRIKVYQRNGEVLTSWQCSHPDALAIKDNRIFVTSGVEHNVCEFTREGKIQRQWGSFLFPIDLAIDQNEIFVLDARKFEVLVFSMNGEPLRQWGSKGLNPGQFYNLCGIAISRNLIYILEKRNLVQVFTRNGRYLFSFNVPDSDLSRILLFKDRAYITDAKTGTVHIFEVEP